MDRRDYLPLLIFNQIYKEIDGLYHHYAKSCGLPDAAFWVLYSLAENDQISTQRELCSAWCYSPQTVNSALKKLEAQGLVKLESMKDIGRNKQILFTDAGKALLQTVILPLMAAEQHTFDDLGEAKRDELLSLTQEYASLLRININQIINTSSED